MLYTIFELSLSILECSISCLDGYTLNSTLCSCTLTDICVADNPCTNGVCELVSSPDQYTCNCTGTNYMGTNCSGTQHNSIVYNLYIIEYNTVYNRVYTVYNRV